MTTCSPELCFDDAMSGIGFCYRLAMLVVAKVSGIGWLCGIGLTLILMCIVPEDVFQEMSQWLKLHQQPQSKLLLYWRKTAKKRIIYIHSANCPSFNSVLQEWPRYQDKDGHVLVIVVNVFHV